MDDIKTRQGRQENTRTHERRFFSARPVRNEPKKKQRHQGEIYWLVRSLGKAASTKKHGSWHRFTTSDFAKWPDKNLRQRVYAIMVLVLFLASTLATLIQPLLENRPFQIPEAVRSVLPEPNQNLANYLDFNAKEAKFVYNDGYKGIQDPEASKTGNGSPRITASFAQDPAQGVTVTDPVNQVDFSLKPAYKLSPAKQDSNQLFYDLAGINGYLVYTSMIATIKEDIVIESTKKDKLEFKYELVTAEGTEARLESDGSVGVYGSSLPINGNVSTGNEQDTELLQKVRQNGEKNKLLFVIPAPVTKELGQTKSSVRTYFELEGSKLTVIAEGLKAASFPLSIDPSVYVQSAAQLMKGNNESNIEFDVENELFKKGSTTGARIDEWTTTTDMNESVWNNSTAAAGGYIYRAGGQVGRVMPHIVEKKKTTQDTLSTSFTMQMPDTRPAGDLYIAVISHDGTGAVTPPAGGGWTEYADVREHAAYYKIGTNQGGGNEAATYAWTGSNVEWAGVILRIKNFNSADIVSGTAASTSSGSAVTPVFPSVTPDVQGALVIRAAGFNDDIPAIRGFSPTDHDDVISGHSGGGGTTDSGFVVSNLDSPPLSGVATGTATLSTSSDVSDTYGSSSIAINGIVPPNVYSQSLQWAKFNNSTGSIESPNPGTGACSGWCTNTAYDLPLGFTTSDGAGLFGASLVAYNGYLYAIGGHDYISLKSTVYIAKLGVSGEPSLWHPTDPNEANWGYWFKDTGLNGGGVRAHSSAYAYNGKMYVVGGTSTGSGNTGALSTVEIADILPNGKLGSWSAGPSLPAARYDTGVQVYNNYMYVVGGNNNGTMLNTVHYSRLNSDGSMNAWQTAGVDGSSFTTARSSSGGLMTGIWGGYLYLAGGCTAVNGSGICTSIAGDVQLASINADGTLDTWNTMLHLRHKRIGSSFIAWQGSLYRFGGCSRVDASTGECYATHVNVQYGNINQDGDASTVSVTTASGVGLCTSTDPYDCNLPPLGDGAGQGGHMLSSTAILNGYLYVMGGCAAFTCSGGAAVSGNISYAAISSDGKLRSPPSCQSTMYGSWCVDEVNRINGTTGVAASGVSVFGGNIYVVGGLNGSANVNSVWRNTTNGDGSLSGSWTAQTFANLGVTTSVSYTFAYSRANPSNPTYPGNLYIFGGCGASSQAGCTAYESDVYKCNILASGALEEANANDCTTDGQLTIDTEAAGGTQGLGIHAGAVYANYIYLVGGVSTNVVDRTSVFYAKFDNSNNVVAVSGGAWIESPVQLRTGRRRGTAFGYNGYLYAVGGFEATVNTALDTIEFVKLNVSDGSLVSSDNLFKQSAVTISQRWGLSLAVSNSFAYIIGGCNVGSSPGGCSSFNSTIQTFQVYNNNSGAPGGYTASANQFATDRLGASAAIVNGYMYIAGGCISITDCTAATNQSQYAPIDANGTVGAWTDTTGTFPEFRVYGQLEVVGGSLYYIGGQGNGGAQKSTVYWGTPAGNGDVASFVAATKQLGDTGSGATERTQLSAAVWNNRIYVTGGTNLSSSVTNTVFVSPSLSAGGDITSNWTSTTAFNVARSGHVAIAYANNLYILGGYDSTNYLSDVQFTQINSDGSLDSWSYTTSLPAPLRQADGFASNGYMYLFGGRSSVNDCTARTLVAPISANTTIASGNNPTGIGEWYQTNRNFDGGRYGAAAVNYQGKAYVLGGGCQGVVMQDDFDPNYDATQWSYTTNFSADTICQSTSSSNTFRANDGNDLTTYAATKSVNVSSGGTLTFKMYIPQSNTGSCLAPDPPGFLSGVTEDVELQFSTGGPYTTIGLYSANNYNTLRRVIVPITGGMMSANTIFRWIYDPDGEAGDMFAIEDVSIIANGSGDISYTAGSRVSQTTLLSQPQIASYSRLIDADKDVFPTKWLLNGLDHSIGARWQMSYRSMNDSTVTDPLKACGGTAMSTYGQQTNFGNVTLGNPETYTVKNSGGTDIGCSRYFFMNISIDASQTYGYPEDVTRGPTLTDLTLFFKANPGKRLIHGKTFIEGIQQPLDTQPGP